MSSATKNSDEKKPIANATPSDLPAATSSPTKVAETPADRHFMTPSDIKPKFMTEDDVIYPKLIRAEPETAPQLLVFELPLLIHLGLFFLYDLSVGQVWALVLNVIISFTLSLISVNLFNQGARSTVHKVSLYGIGTFALLSMFYFLYNAYIFYTTWTLRVFPVFQNLF